MHNTVQYRKLTFLSNISSSSRSFKYKYASTQTAFSMTCTQINTENNTNCTDCSSLKYCHDISTQ